MQPILVKPRLVHVVRAAAFGGALITLAACGDSSPKRDVVPASITPSSTDTIRGPVGTAVSTVLSVTVKNAAGDPVDSALVTFAASAGGGTVSSPSGFTDATGKASTSWTLGNTAGVQTVTATTGTLKTTFTAVAAAKAAANVAKLAGDAQTAAAGATLLVAPSVKITDALGNPVAGVLVTFSAASGGGSVTGALVNSDANGVATVGSWKLGAAAGPNTLTAAPAGLTAVTFSATATAGAVTQVIITSAAPTLSVGQTTTVVAQAKDANNNVVNGAAITFSSANAAVATVGASSGVVTAVGAGSTTVTATSGTATAQLAVNVLGRPGAAVLGTVALASSIGGLSVSGNTAFVGRATANALGVIDLPSATLTTSVDLAAQPVGVSSNAARTLVAVATANPNLVWFVSGATNVHTDSIELAAAPVKIAMTASGSKLFVALNTFQILVVDVASRGVTTTLNSNGTVVAMKIGAGDTLLYVATKFGVISEISVATNTVRRQFNTGLTIVDFAISPNGKNLFIADGSTTVTVVALASDGLVDGTAIPFAGSATAVAVTPDGAQLWTGIVGAIVVNPVSTVVGVPTTTTVTGLSATAIVFNALGTLAAVADVAGNQIVIFK